MRSLQIDFALRSDERASDAFPRADSARIGCRIIVSFQYAADGNNAADERITETAVRRRQAAFRRAL
jgi:hypothetical protein